jgi:hypothetical protein
MFVTRHYSSANDKLVQRNERVLDSSTYTFLTSDTTIIQFFLILLSQVTPSRIHIGPSPAPAPPPHPPQIPPFLTQSDGDFGSYPHFLIKYVVFLSQLPYCL